MTEDIKKIHEYWKNHYNSYPKATHTSLFKLDINCTEFKLLIAIFALITDFPEYREKLERPMASSFLKEITGIAKHHIGRELLSLQKKQLIKISPPTNKHPRIISIVPYFKKIYSGDFNKNTEALE